MDDGMNGGERRQEIHAGAGSPLIEAARRGIEVSRPIAGHHALPVACRAEMPVRRHDHGHRVNRDRRAERRISHAGNIPSVTTRDRHSRHRAVRDAETAQVAVTADQDAARAEKVTAVLIKRCRTVLTERRCYITK